MVTRHIALAVLAFCLLCGNRPSSLDVGASEVPASFASTASPPRLTPPYPPSPVIQSISWHTSTHWYAALGSDLWPTTWASDGNIYSAWGDGNGFQGATKWSIGFARITGMPPSIAGTDVWEGGWPPASSGTGKSGKMIAVDGTLYANINRQDGTWPNTTDQLAWSSDLGATWELASWTWPKGTGKFKPGAFVNYGKDHAGAGTYVYLYGRDEGANPGNTYCARVARTKLKDRPSYQFYAGMASGQPIWSADVNQRAAVFTDPNGGGGLQAVYNPALNRYIANADHGHAGQQGFFDAPDPWGPWTTFGYVENWLGITGGEPLVVGFPIKWMSNGGKTLWPVFSVWGPDVTGVYHDRFNLMKATLTLGSSAFKQSSGVDGIVSIDAEHYDTKVSQGGHIWKFVTWPAGYALSGAMKAVPNSGASVNTGYVTASPRMDYRVKFVKTGTHYVWVRGRAGSGLDNSCHAGLNGAASSTSDRIVIAKMGAWVWSKATMDRGSATIDVSTAGVYTVNLWMREDGFYIDKIVLTTNPRYRPSGLGPPESPRE